MTVTSWMMSLGAMPCSVLKAASCSSLDGASGPSSWAKWVNTKWRPLGAIFSSRAFSRSWCGCSWVASFRGELFFKLGKACDDLDRFNGLGDVADER